MHYEYILLKKDLSTVFYQFKAGETFVINKLWKKRLPNFSTFQILVLLTFGLWDCDS
jgi:hypothetical protein